jgi:hypothetical protein
MSDTILDRIAPDELTGDTFDCALRRARAEFLEMPGLILTQAQAARLWCCDADLSGAVLSRLEETRFLVRTQNGSFIRA